MLSRALDLVLLASTALLGHAAAQTTTIANLTVPDTPLVRTASNLAKSSLTEQTYNHVMRSWLLGVTLQKNLPANFSSVDPEAHAVATILHDLGWDNSTFVSKDKRFEVDGAIAAKSFLEAQKALGSAKGFDERKTDLVWDAIALHATPDIALYKQPLVALTMLGTASDFAGPGSDFTGTLTMEQFDAVAAVFPRTGFRDSVVGNMVHICRSKPDTTYNNWQSQFGLRFIPNEYNVTGKQQVDIVADQTLP